MNLTFLQSAVLILILTNSILSTNGQTIIEGQIIDSLNSKPISYVNIGIVNKNIGTVSDLNGHFRIDLPMKYDYENLKISIIGYESKVFKVSEFKNKIKSKQVIQLNETIYELNEVVVQSEKLKIEVLGNNSISKIIQAGFKNNELGNEVGIKIKIKNPSTYLENFNFYVTDCEYDSLLFRVNIYSIKDGMPSNNLLLENIYFSTNIKKGKVTVDLKPYNIVVDEDIIITLEWIQNLGNGGLNFSAGLLKRPMYHRQTSFGEWKKTSMISLGFYVEVKY